MRTSACVKMVHESLHYIIWSDQRTVLMAGEAQAHTLSQGQGSFIVGCGNLQDDKIFMITWKCREAVDGRADVDRLVEREPMLLTADVGVLLEEAERLLPAGKDPVSFLAANPGALLDMQQAGLPSTIDGDLWTADERI